MQDLDTIAGTRIDESYTLEKLIGRGTTGVVYRAKDDREQRVAIKLVRADLNSRNASARYLRGTRLASQLRHPHIVRVLASGRWGAQRRDYYLVMELIEGVSLSLLQHVVLKPIHVVGLIQQVLQAAVYVHARGTLHRDLKPENVMIARRETGELVCGVTDFGIAANRLQDATFTLQGSILGTPNYMAPEQAQGLPSLGPAVDIYAIGVMLYELLCGKLPFVGSVQTILQNKTQKDPPPLEANQPLPTGLADVVMQMVARQPERRFSHAQDAIAALAPFADPPHMAERLWTEVRHVGSHCGQISSGSSTEMPMAGPVDATWVSVEPSNAKQHTWQTDDPPTQLWGREALLQQLDRYACRVEEGEAQLLLLSGPLAVGKSAIMDSFAISVQEQGRFLVLKSIFSQTYPLEGGLRGAITAHLGIRGRSLATVRLAVREHLRQTGEKDPQETEALVNWLRPARTARESHPDSVALHLSPGLRYLRRLARSRPVLLQVDDFHRGGVDAAALIEFLIFEMDVEPCRLMMMGAMVSREVSDDLSQGLLRSAHAEGVRRHMIAVPALTSSEIVSGLRQECHISQARAQEIAERSGGLPLVARGIAHGHVGLPLTSEERTADVNSKSPLDAVLYSMLRRLIVGVLADVSEPEAVKKMLQAIALLGPWVSVSLLTQYLDCSENDPWFESTLDHLIASKMLDEERPDGEERVGLRPQVLSQLLLQDLGTREKRRMHRRAIEILSALPECDPGNLGDHHLALKQTAEAVACWKRAERRALLAGAPYAAAALGQKILLQSAEPERSQWALRVGRILLDSRDPRRAEGVLRPVAFSDTVDLSLVAGDVLCDVYENLGRGEDWRELAERIETHRDQATRVGQHAALCAIAMWRTSHGDEEGGRTAAEQALELAQSPEEVRRAAQRLAFCSLPSGSLQRASWAAERALSASGEHPQRRARSLRTLGVVRMWQGRLEESVELHERVLALARRQGLSARAALALQDLGDALRLSGRWVAASERYQASISAAEALDLGSTVYLARFKLLMCRIAQGPKDPIEPDLEQLTQPALAAGLGLATPFAALLRAWAASKNGHHQEAAAAMSDACVLEEFRIDPQLPAIFEEIRAYLQA